MSQYIGFRNRVQKLTDSAKSLTRAFVDPAARERCQALKWKLGLMKPGFPWTQEREREYQERLSFLPPPPPLTAADKRLMALPYLQTASSEELVAALKLRLSGVVPAQYGRQLPVEPLVNPPSRSTAESTQAEGPAQVSKSATVRHGNESDDRLKDYRDQGGLPYFEI